MEGERKEAERIDDSISFTVWWTLWQHSPRSGGWKGSLGISVQPSTWSRTVTCGIAGQSWLCLSCPWKPSRIETDQPFWAICSCAAPAMQNTHIQLQLPRTRLVTFPSVFAIHYYWEESSSIIFATSLWVVLDCCQISLDFLLYQANQALF